MALFTCCKLRAVRLEHLSALSVDAFLMALTRVAARGVNPRIMVSDNGPNFAGAANLLHAMWNQDNVEQLATARPDIDWKFNPPYASHYGGVFERLIRAAKEALYHALPAHLSLSLEQLQTAFATVEAILNARPLAYFSSDPADPLPLTPAHFLQADAGFPLLTTLMTPGEETSLARKYNTVRRAHSVFVDRFKTEIRPYLQLNNKMHTRKQNRSIRVGDVVTFFMPSSHKKWPLARVTQVYPGRDGCVRTVQLKLPQHNSTKHTCDPLSSKLLLRDVGEIALLLPAEHPSLL